MQEMQKEFGNIFTTDADGYLTNFVKEQEDAAKQVADAYAAAKKKPSEKTNQYYEYVSQRYDDLTKAMEEYTKEVDTYWKMVEEDEELKNQIIENNIKRFNYTIDLHLDTSDFEKDYKKFRKEVIDQIREDDFANQANYSLSGALDDFDDAKEIVEHVQAIQDAIDNMHAGNYNESPYHDDFASAEEDLQKYTKELMERGHDIVDAQKEIKDAWLDAIDAAQEAFDTQLEQFDQVNNLIEHNLDMLEMLYGDEAYEQAEALYQQQADNATKQLAFLKKETDYWKEQMDGAEKGSDVWKEYKKNWEDSLNEMNDTIKDAADYFYSKYEATFNRLSKTLKDTFAGGDWTKRNTLWEDYLDDDDRYLDSLSRANGTYGLILSTQNAISNATVKHQKELNKWLEATKENLEGQTELRQIDLDIAEKELDIILKRQALEDAQNNKTKMRLRRDSQGNYRYQYVADTADVAEKEQELRESIEDLRLLVKDDFKDTVSRMYDQMDEFAQQAAEISEKYGYNTKEWAEQMALLQERYIKKTTKTANDYGEMMRKLIQATGVEATELFGQMGDEFAAALGMDSETYAIFEQMFRPDGQYVDMIDGFISEIYTSAFDGVGEGVKDTFNDVTNLLPSAVADLGTNLGERVRDLLNGFMEEAAANQQQYKENVDSIADMTGQSFGDLTTNIQDAKTATEDLILNNDALINSYNAEILAIQKTSDAVNKLVQDYKELAEAKVKAGAEAILRDGTYQNGTYDPNQYSYGGYDLNKLSSSIDTLSQVIMNLSSFDTGGYTGDAAGGKLAILHPQEYVLNAEDTPNVLAATNIAKQVMDRFADIKAQAMSQVGGVAGSLFSAINSAENNTNTTEQQVIINADFPAVESAREIKQAFNELVNLASQRASGNRRTY